jgi:hypothetical protein
MTNPADLITLRLKGFAKPDTLADAGAALITAGLAEAMRMGLRLTAEGRAAADAAWDKERAGIDVAAIEGVHSAFVALNPRFKGLVTDWQLRDGQPNDHSDAAYDAAIVTRLEVIDAAFEPVLADATRLVPRLVRYRPAFADALVKLRGGEGRFMAAPVVESYHTLWFELHEELIRLTGRTRAAEAAAGHAA